MKRYMLMPAAVAMAIALTQSPAAAQSHGHDVTLHVNPKWKECSFQLDAALTQQAFHQFTREAGLVTYFRPLSDARPMGRGKFEVSAVQWDTNIDDTDAAWNDTFVHPDSTHWLHEGSGLRFPGLMVRAGVTTKTDIGLYVTKNPNANYGFVGGQVQQNLIGGNSDGWVASARTSFVTMYGPEDLNFTVYGTDVVASRRFVLSKWVAVSPYAGASTYLATSHEKSAVVNLEDEHVLGAQAMVGTTLQITRLNLAAEYNQAKLRSISLKVGITL